jgi:hypothetical protein
VLEESASFLWFGGKKLAIVWFDEKVLLLGDCLMKKSLLWLSFHNTMEKVTLIGTIISIFRWSAAQNTLLNVKTSILTQKLRCYRSFYVKQA